MPKKIRELKAMLLKAGFIQRTGKGSHTIWIHEKMADMPITKDSDDAKIYLEKQVKQRLARLEERKSHTAFVNRRSHLVNEK